MNNVTGSTYQAPLFDYGRCEAIRGKIWFAEGFQYPPQWKLSLQAGKTGNLRYLFEYCKVQASANGHENVNQTIYNDKFYWVTSDNHMNNWTTSNNTPRADGPYQGKYITMCD